MSALRCGERRDAASSQATNEAQRAASPSAPACARASQVARRGQVPTEPPMYMQARDREGGLSHKISRPRTVPAETRPRPRRAATRRSGILGCCEGGPVVLVCVLIVGTVRCTCVRPFESRRVKARGPRVWTCCSRKPLRGRETAVRHGCIHAHLDVVVPGRLWDVEMRSRAHRASLQRPELIQRSLTSTSAKHSCGRAPTLHDQTAPHVGYIHRKLTIHLGIHTKAAMARLVAAAAGRGGGYLVLLLLGMACLPSSHG